MSVFNTRRDPRRVGINVDPIADLLHKLADDRVSVHKPCSISPREFTEQDSGGAVDAKVILQDVEPLIDVRVLRRTA